MWSRYLETNDATELVEYHYTFARKMAMKMHKKLPKSIPFEDLECSALQGLWTAIQRFDIERGVPFEAFARQIVNGQILDHLRENDNESRSLRSIQKSYDKAEQELMHELHRPPTESEIADRVGSDETTVIEYKTRINNSNICSIDISFGASNQDIPNISNIIEGKERVHMPMDAVDILRTSIAPWTKPERLLFALIYFESFNLDQAASILDVAHPHACQMHYRMGEQIAKLLDRYTVD